MESLVCPIILLIVGGVMFIQWRKTPKAEKRKATLWMIGSIIFVVFGLIGLLGEFI
jgi:hypothetical protein